MEFRIDAVGKVGGVKRTPQGGLDVPANLTRVGVFTYHQPDGTVQRELRPADEVFKTDSLDTLSGAPLCVGHPGLVRADNWQQHAVGHVGDEVKQDGKFVAARVRVQSAPVVLKVEKKDLVELSCGYTCDLERTPGTFEGEKYDAIQRNIRYNHVALGPANFGRAGNDVKLRMDGVGRYASPMELDAALKEIERLNGELAGAKSRADGFEAQIAAQPVVNIDALVADRLALCEDARTVIGPEAKFDGKTDAQLMQEACSKAYPDLKLDSKSEDFVRGLFQAAVAQSAASLAAVAKTNVRVDAVASTEAKPLHQ